MIMIFLGLIIIFKFDVGKYHAIKDQDADDDADYDADPNSDSVMVQIPFMTAVADGMFHFLPRAAFFDNRDRGRHSNTIVVLGHMKKKQGNNNIIVIGCKVGDYLIQLPEIKSLKINRWLHATHPECTHDDVLIYCYDIPLSIVSNNSVVSVVYVNPENRSEHIAVESEHSLFIPRFNEHDSRSSTVMACTTVFGTPPHFGAWIRYQKTLGMDMVHVNAHESFLSSSSFNDSDFLESLQNGFVQLTVWKEYLPPGSSFYHSQALYYQYCLYRYLGVHDYCVCADTDDFLVPIDDKDFGVQKLVKKLFSDKSIGSTSLYWIRYVEPVNGFDPPEESIRNGNLTQHLNTSIGEYEGTLSKSIYKLSAMLELGVHNSNVFLPSKHFKRITCPQRVGYTAHIKKSHRNS
jgi:hypothetical protein